MVCVWLSQQEEDTPVEAGPEEKRDHMRPTSARSRTTRCTIAPRHIHPLRAAALGVLLAMAGAAEAIDVTWSASVFDQPAAHWYENHWTPQLPTMVDRAVMAEHTSVADMNNVDWGIGSLVMKSTSTICGRYLYDLGRCSEGNEATRPTLTIAPPSAGGVALATQYSDASYQFHGARFEHMGVVSTGRVSIAGGTPIFGDALHHFKMTVADSVWLHSGLIEVNHGGGSGMLALRDSSLGAIGAAPNLQVDHKRFADEQFGGHMSYESLTDSDVYLLASHGRFDEVVMRGQLGLLDSTFTADTLVVTGGGRIDHAWGSTSTVRVATAGNNGGSGIIESSTWATRGETPAHTPKESRALHITESLMLGDDAGSSGKLYVGADTQVVLGTQEVSGVYGERVLRGALSAGSNASVVVNSGASLRVYGQASLGYGGAATLSVGGTNSEMIVTHNLDLGNGLDTASATATVEAGGLLQAANIYVGADYFELNYGDHNPYGSGTATLTVRDSGVVRVTGESYSGGFPGATTSYFPGRVYVGRNDFLNGNGTIEFTNPAGGSVVNLGTVSPGNSPGVLTIDGDFGFTTPGGFGASGGRLVIELGGNAPGTGYDVLHVLGNMDLTGGVLELVAIDGFVPDANDVFAFLRVDGAIRGSFSSLVDRTGLGLTLADIQFGPGGIVGLNTAAVPEPGEWAMLAAGLGVMMWRRRRQAV